MRGARTWRIGTVCQRCFLVAALLVLLAASEPAVGFAAVPPNSIATAPPFSNTRTVTMVYAAWASAGVGTVELWAKGPDDPQYSLVATDTTPQTPSFTFQARSDGIHQFYTRAQDNLGSYEPAPEGADSATNVDTVAPTTSASGPGSSTSTMIEIDYSVSDSSPSSGLDRVELWGRGPETTAYTRLDSQSHPSASGSFEVELPSRAGSYRFYTVAVDKAGNIEPAPADGDVTTALVDPGVPAEGLVAFESDRDGDFDIYTVNSDGTGWVEELIDWPSDERDLAWSPTGAEVAFASDRNGDFDIYVMNADGSKLRQLTDSPGDDTSPTWSPTGQIAFDSGELYAMDEDGNNQRLVTGPGCPNPDDDGDCGGVWDPSWSPDGTRIVFTRTLFRDLHGLQIINADGTGEVRFWGGYETGADWSTDNRIAAATVGDDPDIYYLNPDRSGYTVVTEDHGDHSPSWSPDNGALAFVRPAGAGLFRIEDDGTNVRRLTRNLARDLEPDWEPRRYASVKGFCEAQRAQIGSKAFARLYNPRGGKNKNAPDKACRAAHREDF